MYKTTKGLDKYRPSQKTPISNLFLAGDYTQQMYLASMEGAVLSGKLCATEIAKAVNSLPSNEAAPAPQAAVGSQV